MTGLEDLLRALTRDEREWLQVATVDRVVDHESWGSALEVTVQPSGRPAVARIASLGAVIFVPYNEGDEVLLFCPGGDINRAIAIGQPASSEAKAPSDYQHDRVLLQRLTEIRSSAGAPVSPVVTGDVLSELGAAAAIVVKLSAAVNVLAPGTITPEEIAQVTQLTVNIDLGLYASPGLSAERAVVEA